MANEPHLEALRDSQGICAGIYTCSLCSAEFSSSPSKPGELTLAFNVHVGHVHGSRQNLIEAVSETSERVVEKAIQKRKKKSI